MDTLYAGPKVEEVFLYYPEFFSVPGGKPSEKVPTIDAGLGVESVLP
ncbi:MAG TPA: hypothetical protein PKY88_07165 [Anaerohalosphaeraceae bacterium]|nr:hypothetical protein [Anaerohalosphaeraceae bacterium]